MGPVKVAVPLVLSLLIAACGSSEPEPIQAQRISLDEARARPAEPMASPNTRGAGWQVSENGRSIDFGRPGGQPLLSLECQLREEPVRMTIVRHAPSRPGQKALFPVIGNGEVSRFKVDAALADGEWRWQGELDAADPLLDVFAGPLELTATLPGGGMLEIEGSRIPGEFVTWCRAGGKAPEPDAEKPDAEPTAAPPAR
jgi:hypothetical protein